MVQMKTRKMDEMEMLSKSGCDHVRASHSQHPASYTYTVYSIRTEQVFPLRPPFADKMDIYNVGQMKTSKMDEMEKLYQLCLCIISLL